MARKASTKTESPANLGFEATALRGSAFLQSEAKPQVMSEAKDNYGKENADTFRNVQHPDLSRN